MRYYMRSCKKLMAVLTAALLLCGCTNNGGSSVTETDPTAETAAAVDPTAEASAELSAPEQGGAFQETASSSPVDPGNSGGDVEAAQNPGAGVDLVSGEFSENSLIFDLNGKYCDVSDLPFSVQTFQPDIDPEEIIFLRACGGKLLMMKGERLGEYTDEYYAGGEIQWTIYSHDLSSRETSEVYTSLVYPSYIDDTYVVFSPSLESITAVNYTTGKTVFAQRNDPDKYTFYVTPNCIIVNDQLYFDGTYNITEFKKTIPVVFRANLANGDMDILCSGMSEPRYGVANVCFKMELPNADVDVYTNFRGEIFSERNDKLRGVSTIFTDTYFPIEYDILYDEHLGSRDKICWIDKYEESHEIGTTGFKYELDVSYNSNPAHIIRDGIYLLELVRYDQENFTVNSTFRHLIGRYDEETGVNTAALIENDGNDYVFVENTAIYIVDPDTLETMVLSMPE